VHQYANRQSERCAPVESKTLSTNNCRTSRQRPAPSAAAVRPPSAGRCTFRAYRFATLGARDQEKERNRAINNSSAGRTCPETTSDSGSTRAPWPELLPGRRARCGSNGADLGPGLLWSYPVLQAREDSPRNGRHGRSDAGVGIPAAPKVRPSSPRNGNRNSGRHHTDHAVDVPLRVSPLADERTRTARRPERPVVGANACRHGQGSLSMEPSTA